MVEGGMKCVKILLFGFNLIFVVTAIALIAAGAYVQHNLSDYFDLIGGKFSAAAALLIAVGVIIFFIATFGCCGAYRESYPCVMIFAVLLGLIFVLEIAGGITGFVLKNQVLDGVKDLMRESEKNYKPGNVWDKVQKDFNCCGIEDYKSWADSKAFNGTELPNSCCNPVSNCTTTSPTLRTQGCLNKFGAWVEDHVYIVGGVGIGLAFVQIVGIMFACCLARAIKKEYEVV
ncbi:hypothetical protein ScPMuIL_016845 [Solemya velum]